MYLPQHYYWIILSPTPTSPRKTDRRCYNSRTFNETCSPTGDDMKASLRRAVKGSSHASLRVKVTHLLPNMQICLSHYDPPYYTAHPRVLFGLGSAPRKEQAGSVRFTQLSVNSRPSSLVVGEPLQISPLEEQGAKRKFHSSYYSLVEGIKNKFISEIKFTKYEKRNVTGRLK